MDIIILIINLLLILFLVFSHIVVMWIITNDMKDYSKSKREKLTDSQNINLIILDGTKHIKQNAFRNNKNIIRVYIPNTVKRIGKNAFLGCVNLKYVEFETNSQLKVVGKNSFCSCRLLKNIDLPSGLTKIGESAFANTGIEKIKIPNSVKNICKFSFNLCSNLKSVTFEENSKLKRISAHAFSICYKLSNVTFPNSLEHISKSAFFCDFSINSITLPPYLTEIDKNAFRGCNIYEIYNLSKIDINKCPIENGYVGSRAKVIHKSLSEKSKLFAEDGIIYFVDKNEKIAVAPKDDDIKNLVIVKDCTTIGDSAFRDCGNILSIHLPENLKSIGKEAFFLTTIAEIYNSSKLNIVAGSSENGYIGEYAKHIYSKKPDVNNFVINNGVIYYIDQDKKIAIAPENKYVTRIVFDNDCTEISVSVFKNCVNLESVFIPAGVTKICKSAFSNCYSLKNVLIENRSKLSVIQELAFFKCYNLQSIIIPPSVKFMGNDIFSMCDSLQYVFYKGTPYEFSKVELSLFRNYTLLEKIAYYYDENTKKDIDIDKKYWCYSENDKVVFIKFK